nr:uncharacterized protein LOC105484955 [Macaca nemestrina]
MSVSSAQNRRLFCPTCRRLGVAGSPWVTDTRKPTSRVAQGALTWQLARRRTGCRRSRKWRLGAPGLRAVLFRSGEGVSRATPTSGLCTLHHSRADVMARSPAVLPSQAPGLPGRQGRGQESPTVGVPRACAAVPLCALSPPPRKTSCTCEGHFGGFLSVSPTLSCGATSKEHCPFWELVNLDLGEHEESARENDVSRNRRSKEGVTASGNKALSCSL